MGRQLRERKRLDKIVVGAAVQPRDSILHGVAGRQHQDWNSQSPMPESGQNFESVSAGQAQVQYDDIKGLVGRAEVPILTGPGNNDFVALTGQPSPESARDLEVVLDNE